MRPQPVKALKSELLLLNLELGRVTGQREWRRWKPDARRLCCCEPAGEAPVASRLRRFCHTKEEEEEQR